MGGFNGLFAKCIRGGQPNLNAKSNILSNLLGAGSMVLFYGLFLVALGFWLFSVDQKIVMTEVGYKKA